MTKVTLHKKNGETFTGEPYECAERLMRDALGNAYNAKDGLQAQWCLWGVLDFCKTFGISAYFLAKDCGVREPQKLGIYEV